MTLLKDYIEIVYSRTQAINQGAVAFKCQLGYSKMADIFQVTLTFTYICMFLRIDFLDW